MLLTLVLFLGESHGLYRPRGHRELDTTEQLSLSQTSEVTGMHAVGQK